MPAKIKPRYKIPSHLMVKGVRAIEQHAIANQSQLLLPEEFQSNEFAAKWAFVGASADKARLPQNLVPGYTIEGWDVWKYPSGPEKDKPCIRPLGNKQAILMFRTKVLQKAVNAICGNISRERTIAEQEGRTIQGQVVQDAGMLTDDTLRRYDPSERAERSPTFYEYNQIPKAAKPSAGRSGRVRTRSQST